MSDRDSRSTVGAGDTFIAGMLFGLTVLGHEWDLREKVIFARDLAERKVSQEGFAGVADYVLTQHNFGIDE